MSKVKMIKFLTSYVEKTVFHTPQLEKTIEM
jgi:hypothetical protein